MSTLFLNGTDPDNMSRLLGFDLAFLYDIMFVWINMILIILILAWLLYNPVKTFLHNRRDRILSEIEAAAENLRISEETKAQYNDKLAGIRAERDEILDTARKMAGEREADIIARANTEAGLLIERARREIDQEREKAKDEIRNQIIQVSAMMAERLMGNHMDAAARDQILDQAITELGDAPWRN